jgi:protoheme IX farnesyltransferase
MGWTTATGRLGAGGLALFAILFLWQIPHFLAIAIYRRDDYARAGFRVMSVVYGERACRAQVALWAVAFVAATLVPFGLGLAGPIYLAVAAALGVPFLGTALAGLRARVRAGWARTVFLASIAHLCALFAVLMLDAR